MMHPDAAVDLVVQADLAVRLEALPQAEGGARIDDIVAAVRSGRDRD
jgi:hypothetical protein